MRKLILQRKKSFVASLMKIKFYITDDTANEVLIHGRKCRKLGALKNGMTDSFDISDEEVTVFATIDDGLVKGIQSARAMPLEIGRCVTDQKRIPSGREEIVICGKNVLNPLRGNPFVFE